MNGPAVNEVWQSKVISPGTAATAIRIEILTILADGESIEVRDLRTGAIYVVPHAWFGAIFTRYEGTAAP